MLSVDASEYGTLAEGRQATLFRLAGASGVVAEVTDYGAILVSLAAPDRHGRSADLTLGYDSLDGWLTNTEYFGATVGRFGNRVAHGRFILDGETFHLATNNAPGDIPCHLHGGVRGFDTRMWASETFDTGDSCGVRLSYTSPDGEEGYPGTLTATVTYTLTDSGELWWEARATTDAPTIVNLVHHSYWNLSGDQTRSIDDHQLTLYADHYLPTDAGLIPTGEIAPVAGTPMDFTTAGEIGRWMDDNFEALQLAGGYDHCWVLGVENGGLSRAARVHHPGSGRTMEVFTNQPGVQFYSGNFLDGSIIGKGGIAYGQRAGVCLETENFPDAPNQATFPSAVLRPGDEYHHVMVHRFSTV